jgi:hypothetical protein
VRRFDQPARIIQIRQDQTLATDISRTQREHLADTRPRRPERGEQQTITLGRRRGDNRTDLLGRRPSGGCQRLLVGLTERGLPAEFDSTRADGEGKVILEPGGWRPFTILQFNIPIGRLKSTAPISNLDSGSAPSYARRRDLDGASTAIPTR